MVDKGAFIARFPNGVAFPRIFVDGFSAMQYTITACVAVLLMAAMSVRAHAQTSKPTTSPSAGIDLASLTERERTDLTKLLDSKDWPIRVFGMMRLERYRGDAIPGLIRDRLHDSAWQVRCFAVDQAARMKVPLNTESFANETDGRVLRAALRHGVKIPEKDLTKIATKLLRTEDLDSLMLGIELAAASDSKTLRGE